MIPIPELIFKYLLEEFVFIGGTIGDKLVCLNPNLNITNYLKDRQIRVGIDFPISEASLPYIRIFNMSTPESIEVIGMELTSQNENTLNTIGAYYKPTIQVSVYSQHILVSSILALYLWGIFRLPDSLRFLDANGINILKISYPALGYIPELLPNLVYSASLNIECAVSPNIQVLHDYNAMVIKTASVEIKDINNDYNNILNFKIVIK